MKTKNKKFSAILLAVISLILVFSLVLSACNGQTTEEDNQNTEQEQPADNNTQPGDGEKDNDPTEDPVARAALRVTFDEEAEFALTDTADYSESINVEIVVGDVSRKIDNFTVKSATLSADGKYIEVVIAAEGLEETVLLPLGEGSHEIVDDLGIRAELLPLYNLLSTEGDKGFALTLSGSYQENAAADEQAFTVKALLNLLAEEGVEAALVNENDEAIVLFKDNILTVGGTTVDVTRIAKLIAAFTGMGVDDNTIVFEDEALAAAEDEDIVGTYPEEGDFEYEFFEDDITYGEENSLLFVFSYLSAALDELDAYVDNPLVARMGISLTKVDGVYTLKVSSDKLVTWLKSIPTDELESDMDIDEIIDSVDELLDGALKSGDIKFTVTLAIKEGSISVGAQIVNEKTGTDAAINALLSYADEAYELPEAADAQAYDIEITVPFALPQKDIEAKLTAVIHISDMFAEAGKDYVTATFDISEGQKNISAMFVLNDNYAYMEYMGMTFYDAFELNGEPASIIDLLMAGMSRGGNKYPDYPDYPPYEEDESPFSSWGFGLNYDEDAIDFALPIGTTEEELRSMLMVTIGRDDQPYFDYTIDGFDSSYSHEGEFNIILDEDHIIEGRGYVIYDAEKAHEVSVYVDQNEIIKVELGETVGSVQTGITGVRVFSDDTVNWSKLALDGFIIKGFSNDTYVEEEATEETTFDAVGYYWLTLANGDNICAGQAYVYDPANLVPVELYAENSIWLSKDYTQDDIAAQLIIYVVYDNETMEQITDYQFGEPVIEDEYNAYITVYWNDLTVFVPVYFMDEPDYPIDPDYPSEENTFDIMELVKYLRFVDIDEEADPMDIMTDAIDALKAIYEENKELLETAVTITEDENGGSIHVIISSEDEEDLIDFINCFIGIPTEEGWVDIDVETIYSAIEELDETTEFTIINGFESIIGVELRSFLSELFFDGTVSFNDGLNIALELNGGNAETVYVATGLGIRFVEAGEQFELPEDLSNASSFEMLFGLFVKE